MKGFNLFYIAVLAIGLALFLILKPKEVELLSFYGFAESNETEINYNYPVVVDRIMVRPGQEVKKGEVLLEISRRKSKETLEDQEFRIRELRADEAIWRQKEDGKLAGIINRNKEKIEAIDLQIEQLKKELVYKKSLAEGLKTIEPKTSSYNPIQENINELEQRKKSLQITHQVELKTIQSAIDIGDNPYKEQISRLQAELVFEEGQKVQPITVVAPNDGLIGNINCKEEEHIPSYSTLLSFYEPHSGVVKGFVHENLTLKVQLGNLFRVGSLKDETISYEGKVIGLGSRIVEIPPRLRKLVEFKTYGREVLIEITKENHFLQKEKVSISTISQIGL